MVPCVIWRRDAERLGHELEDGQSVIAFGSIGHYAAGGRYQFYVRGAELAGIGERYLQVERWRCELGAEGCFQEFRKRGLPRYPVRVGVVTSSTGAVLHDIVNVLRRRFPVELVLSPTAVQGDGAEARDRGRDPADRRSGRRDHRRARRGVVRGPLRLQPSGRRPGGLCLRDAGRLGRRARGRRDPLRPRGRPPCAHPVGRGRDWSRPTGPCSSTTSGRHAGGSWTCCTGDGSAPTTRSRDLRDRLRPARLAFRIDRRREELAELDSRLGRGRRPRARAPAGRARGARGRAPGTVAVRAARPGICSHRARRAPGAGGRRARAGRPGHGTVRAGTREDAGRGGMR